MNIKVTYRSAIKLDVTPCQEVKLCLSPEWADQTVSGEATIIAKVTNSTPRRLGMGASWARGADVLQYAFSIDDAQILEETPGVKFKFDCADILGVVDNVCPTAA